MQINSILRRAKATQHRGLRWNPHAWPEGFRRPPPSVCCDYSALSKSLTASLAASREAALETFNSLGIAFVSLGEQIDTSTPAGRMVFTVLGAVAELERSLIAERVRAGMRNARAKGKIIGRPPRAQLTPEDRKSIAEAYWCRKTSFRQLAKKFDTSIGTVQRCTLAYQNVLGGASRTR